MANQMDEIANSAEQILLALAPPENLSAEIQQARNLALSDYPYASALPPLLPVAVLNTIPRRPILDQIRAFGFPPAERGEAFQGKSGDLCFWGFSYNADASWLRYLWQLLDQRGILASNGMLPLPRTIEDRAQFPLVLGLHDEPVPPTAGMLVTPPHSLSRPLLELYSIHFDFDSGFFGLRWDRYYQERMRLFKSQQMP